MTRFLKTYWVPIACLVASALKLALCVNMPLNVHAGATYDDVWAVRAADFLASGQWLGPYDYTTLIKNIGFPLYLAACIKLGAGYLLPTALLYIAASAYFTAAIRPLFKRTWMLLPIFLLLVFNPMSFATDTYQRLYRNSIVAAQVLFVFGSYIGLYVRVKGEGSPRPAALVIWALVCAASLAWFWVTREDSVWIAPFALVATVVVCASLLRSNASRTVSLLLCALALLPLVCTGAATAMLRSANQGQYGVSVLAEINEANFARMVQGLYAIAPGTPPENQRVACPHESLMRAYDASSTLKSVKSKVEDRFYHWGDAIDGDPGDGEVNGGEFFWVMRLAAHDAGVYTSASNADAFFGRIADELDDAFAAGTLGKRAVMPSSIMTPWRSEYAGELPHALIDIYAHAASLQDVTSLPFAAQGPSDGIAYFERIARGGAYSQGDAIPPACQVGEGIIWLYRVISPALVLCAIIAYLALLVLWLAGLFSTRAGGSRGALVLVLTSLLLGTAPLAFGLAYSLISSFEPIAYYYYGVALYPILAAFSVCAIFGFADSLLKTGGD